MGPVRTACLERGKSFPIGLTLQGRFEDVTGGGIQPGGVSRGDCGGTPTTAAGTSVDIQGVYYIELDSFHVDQTR
jgi:hypothetical protein